MPKAIRSLTTNAREGHSRRSIVAGLAAMVPAVMAIPAAAKGCGDDAELIDCAARALELFAQERLDNENSAKAYEQFKAMEPPKPRSLLWRVSDPVRYDDYEPLVEDGKTYLWCRGWEIPKLRGKEFWQYEFIGTDKDYKALGLDSVSDAELTLRWPVKGQEHLWNRWPQKRQQERAAELVKAYDDWCAAVEAAQELSGLNAAEAAGDVTRDEMTDILNRAVNLTPNTLEGYRALASIMIHLCWDGKIEAPRCGADKAIAVILTTLTGIPIEQNAADQDAA